MVEKIKTYIYRVGDVVFLTDKQTKIAGHHPYIILSDVSTDSYEVICMGMTSCSHKDTYNVIPVECPDGKIGYIIPNQIFRYTIRDICDGKFAFSLDFKFAMKLRMYYLDKIGMGSEPNINQELYSLFVDVIHDGDTIKHGKHSIGYRIPGEASPNPLNLERAQERTETKMYSEQNLTVSPSQDGKPTTSITTNPPKKHKQPSPVSSDHMWRIPNVPSPDKWSDEQVRFAHSALQIRGGKQKISCELGISLSSLYRHEFRITKEFNDRGLSYLPSINWENSPFRNKEVVEKKDEKKINEVGKPNVTNVQPVQPTVSQNEKKSEPKPDTPERFSNKTKYDVKFWEVNDLIRYKKLYDSHAYEILKSELGLDKSKQISVFASVQVRLAALGIR